jgi:hypothetical protein
MRNVVAAGALLLSLSFATCASAQLAGAVAEPGCGMLVPHLTAAGAELYALKTHNAGGGPDFHQDWLFDLTATGGGRTTNTFVGADSWQVPDEFARQTVPPEELFVVLTFPGGRLAIDSTSARGTSENMGVVQIQRVGDSLPVGVGAGIGLEMSGTAAPYTAAVGDRAGGLASFPYGTQAAIVVAFAPIAEINSDDPTGSGCTVGGSVLDEEPGFGVIVGYNVYRVEGVPSVVPSPSDFVGHWEYYVPYSSFDLDLAESPGSGGPDRNGDTLSDGDGTPAPNDGDPNDLVGFINPDGLGHTGDEVLLFQDAALNPDGTPRRSGTAPDVSGGRGYWYAVQPVLWQGRTLLQDFDGTGFGRAGEFAGTHAIDTDADTVAESLDVDLDGRRDFYSPQVVSGQTGLGLTHAGVPLLSQPVWGRANPLAATAPPRLTGRAASGAVRLTLATGLETGSIVGYEIVRLASGDAPAVLVEGRSIVAEGGEGNTYDVTDRLPLAMRRARARQVAYEVRVLLADGAGPTFGPFTVDVAPLARRGGR